MIKVIHEETLEEIREVKNYYNFFTTEWVESGESEMSFSVPATKDNLDGLREERIIVENWNRWIIKSVEMYSGTATFICKIDTTELLEKPVLDFRMTDISLQNVLTLCMEGTGWTWLYSEISTINRTVELEAGNTLDLLRVIQKVYGTILRYDGLTKRILIYKPENYVNKGTYFMEDVNIKKISYAGDTYDYCTKLYAYGKENMTFADINAGNPFVVLNEYNTKVVTRVWRDERYTNKEELLAEARRKLKDTNSPLVNYEIDLIDLWNINQEKYKNLKVEIGDKITLVDPFKQMALEWQIVKYLHYHDEPERNVIELGSVTKDLSAFVDTEIKNEINKTPMSALPSGGETGQTIVKNPDGTTGWGTPSGGEGVMLRRLI